MGGFSAIYLDTKIASTRDDLVIIPIVLLVVFLILMLLLRALVAPVILIGTVVLSFGAALGISALLFEYVLGFAGADPAFPLFAFVFLVALGIDYNIFLMTRVREETAVFGTRRGSLVALTSTGGVITSAGRGAGRDVPGARHAAAGLPRRAGAHRGARGAARHDDRAVGAGHRDQPRPRRPHLVAEPARPRRARGRAGERGRGAGRGHAAETAGSRESQRSGRGMPSALPHLSSIEMTDAPTPQQVRRSLARAERGAALDVAEATALLAARDDDLDRLCAVAARVRDAGLVAAGRPGVVTYSPKVFIPVTTLCRDRCHYCTFVESPGQLERSGRSMFLSPDEILEIARQGAELGCLEALFTLGDRPEDRWPEAQAWLDEQGYDSTLAYVRAMAVRVLEETGLLPHLNPGVMTWEELNRLKPVSPSMGMMLETTSRRLFETKGEAHFGSPDKDPAVRLRVLEDAGRLSIPFTTGLLVGIGETLTERAETIFALRETSRRYGAVQEVIVQNFRAKPDTAMRHSDDLALDDFRATIAVTRIVLGPKARMQAPPNLVDLAECRALLEAGVDDWGGVSPLTPDHVNPERPWPSLDRLTDLTAQCGFELKPRLTVHPEYVRAGEPWLDPRVSGHVAALAVHDGPDAGLARPGVRPAGLPWQEPDGGFAAVGRTDLHTAVDTEGRTDDRRSDFAGVYGDWESVREDAVRTSTEPARRTRQSPGQSSTRCPGRAGSRVRIVRTIRAGGRRARPGRAVRRARADADDRRGRPARRR